MSRYDGKGLLYKLLKKGRSTCGDLKWSLPKRRGDAWTPGKWHEVEGELVQCQNGLHFTTDPIRRTGYTDPKDPEVYLAEIGDEYMQRRDDDEVVARKARLLRRLDRSELVALGLLDALVPSDGIGPFYVAVHPKESPALSLPTRADKRWRPGKYHKVKGALSVDNGIKLTLGLKGLGSFKSYKAPKIYLAEVRGDVIQPKDRPGTVFAAEVRLVRELSWAEMKRADIVHGPRISISGETPVLSAVHFMVRQGKGLSDRQGGYGVVAAIKAAVKMRIPFALGDFASIATSKSIFQWWGADHGEWMYEFLVREDHESATRSFEAWKGRKPWVLGEKRLSIGNAFRWTDAQRPVMFKVTSFDDEAGTMTACEYRSVYKRRPGTNEHYDQEVIGRRVTFTHAEIDAAEKAHAAQKAEVTECEALASALRYDGRVPLYANEIHSWTAEQREEARAWLTANKKRAWGKPPIPKPAFLAEVHARAEEKARREEVRSDLQKRRWKAGDRQGKSYDFQLEIPEAHIDAEIARRARNVVADVA